MARKHNGVYLGEEGINRREDIKERVVGKTQYRAMIYMSY